jgi:hypothetical protein
LLTTETRRRSQQNAGEGQRRHSKIKGVDHRKPFVRVKRLSHRFAFFYL